MDKSKMFMQIKFAEAAQFQGNTNLALTKLKEIHKTLNKIQSRELKDLQIAWMHCYLKTHLNKAKLNNNSPEDGLTKFFNALSLKEIVKYDNSSDFIVYKELHQNHQLLHGQFCRFLVESLIGAYNNSPCYFETFKSDDRKRKQLSEYIQSDTFSDMDDIVTKLISHGVKNLSKLSNDLKGSLELATYCDHFLRQVENEDEETAGLSDSQSPNFKLGQIELIKREFPDVIVKELLNAIKLDSYEARRRFPRLLQIVELYKHQTLDSFIR